MNKTMRMGAVGVLVALALAVSALPAAAFDIVIFTGKATVCADSIRNASGKYKAPAPNCPDNAKRNGLYIVGHPGGKNTAPGGLRTDVADSRKWVGRNGNFRFQSGGFVVGQAPPCVKYNPLGDGANGPQDCTIDVSGQLVPVAGIGAACGMSEGRNGQGLITSANGRVVHVWNVGWPVSAGGTLPIKGDYHFKDPGPKHPAKPRSGQFFGVVQAQGGANCVKRPAIGVVPEKKHGASSFDVIGIAVMTPAPKKTPKPPKS